MVRDGTVLVVPAVASGLQIPAPGQSVPISIPNDPALVRESPSLQGVEIDAGASGRSVVHARGVELRIGR